MLILVSEINNGGIAIEPSKTTFKENNSLELLQDPVLEELVGAVADI